MLASPRSCAGALSFARLACVEPEFLSANEFARLLHRREASDAEQRLDRHGAVAIENVGSVGDHAMFAPMRDALSLDAFTYCAVDYRGYGKSKGMSGAYSVAEIAADVLAVADKLGWETFSLVGHSMGGKFIQRIMADAPHRVRRAVAVTPVPAAAVPFDDQSWGLFDGAAANLDNRRMIIDFTTGGRLSKTWIDAMARHSEANSTREAFAAYLRAWAKADFHEAVIGNKTPIKVIVGEYDGAINAETMRARYATRFAAYGHAQDWLTHPHLANLLAWRAAKGGYVHRQLEGLFQETSDPSELFSPLGLLKAIVR